MSETPNIQVIPGLGESSAGDRPRTTSLPQLKLDDHTYDRALACVHCGLCLPACPTYTTNGLEGDSPRGRIQIMKDLADGRIDATAPVLEHLDLCLDCRACETACPSGVVYHELIETTRAQLKPQRRQSLNDRMLDLMFNHIFTRPTRLKFALLPARLLQRVGLWNLLANGAPSRLMPASIRKMNRMLPKQGKLWPANLRSHYPATRNRTSQGKPKATVAMFPGCVGSVMYQHVNRKTVELLQLFGCDVVVPKAMTCCGAIPHHAGDEEAARKFIRQNIDAIFPTREGDTPKIDFIVNNIAGCGAGLKDAGHIMRDDAQYADRAAYFSSRVRDITELLVELDPDKPDRAMDRTVAYHHACHLAHAQKVTDPPMTVLSWIPGLKVAPLQESDMCCGAAGTYNLSEPEMATQLGQRKVEHLRAAGVSICVTGNVGCAMQIASEAEAAGLTLELLHPVELLHEAYFGRRS